MEALVKLSFYCFAAASIALASSAVCYLAYAVGRVRVRQATLATSAGTTVVGRTAALEPGSPGAARFGTMLAWFGVVFQGLSIGLRTAAAERLPLSNMYEFSS